MGEVIELKAPEVPEYCYQCGCGGQTFILLFGGCVQCDECRFITTCAAWLMLPPELKSDR